MPCTHIITKRGQEELFSYEIVRQRLVNLAEGLSHVDVDAVLGRTLPGLPSVLSSKEIDEELAKTAAVMSSRHPEYARLAGRLCVRALWKETPSTVLDYISLANGHTNPTTGESQPLLRADICDFVLEHADRLDALLNEYRPAEQNIDFFGFKTLEKSYLLRSKGRVIESIGLHLMRIAVEVSMSEGVEVVETHFRDMMSNAMTHATPTRFNAGSPFPQMSSCYLVSMIDDSIAGIYGTLEKCAQISKYAGGIGLSVHPIRCAGSYIAGTNGRSAGIVPMMRVIDAMCRHISQGSDKRKGSLAVYMEPWHPDIFGFLELRKNTGKEELRARDLFYGLWVPDLFMTRVENGAMWSLIDPSACPKLADCWGPQWEALYEECERENRGIVKRVPAIQVWYAMLESQLETGMPYILFKDACNRKSNQQNLGTIKSSNLCTEIVQYTSKDEIAVCNLASIALPCFVIVETGEFDFDGLMKLAQRCTRYLNRVIDRNFYPVPESERSNRRHRPIGIGIQGLADVFAMLGLPYESDGARKLNREIFETIAFGALTASNDLARETGLTYDSYEGSPLSQGKFQFDLWKQDGADVVLSGRWDWDTLRSRIMEHGVRNSLLVAPMPTASTSQILGNSESFDPLISNIFARKVLAGEFIVVNKHLVRDLEKLGLWNDTMRQRIIAHQGSVQLIAEIPEHLRAVHKTAWEIPQRTMIDLAADRGAFICQSQSFNVYLEEPNGQVLSDILFYGWRKGLKTGMYYLRTRPAVDPIQFTIDPRIVREEREVRQSASVQSLSSSSPPASPPTMVIPADEEREEENEKEKEEMPPSAFVCRMEEGCMMCGS